MESKYYYPDIEDIKVGYECEIKMSYNKEWIKIKADVIYTKLLLESFYDVRTPYLTKEQIENKGWTLLHSFDKTDNWLSYIFNKDDWDLSLILNGIPRIELQLNDQDHHEFDYYGECPSINEFNTICKLLKIK